MGIYLDYSIKYLTKLLKLKKTAAEQWNTFLICHIYVDNVYIYIYSSYIIKG